MGKESPFTESNPKIDMELIKASEWNSDLQTSDFQTTNVTVRWGNIFNQNSSPHRSLKNLLYPPEADVHSILASFSL